MNINILLAFVLGMVFGFIIGAIFFVNSGGVATTDDWKNQQADQRKRKMWKEPR